MSPAVPPSGTTDGLPALDIGRRSAVAGLSLVVIVALVLRLYGLNWDEGYQWTPHPDERAILSKVTELHPPSFDQVSVLFDSEESPLNPGWFPYGSFPLYLLEGVEVLGGVIPGVDIVDLRPPGRVLSAAADAATVVLVFALGSVVSSRRTGLVAAALVALAVIHIQLSHFFAVDTLLALSAVAVMLFLVRVARSGRLIDSCLAGLFLGLGLATKLSLAPILGAYVVAHVMYALQLVPHGHRTSSFTAAAGTALKSAIFGAVVIVVAFLFTQPYALLDWSQFYADFVEQSEMVRRIRDYPYTRQYIDTTPYLYHVRQLATWGLGWPLGVLAWMGCAYVAVRGLRLLPALLYLIFGLAVPAAVLLLATSVIAIGFASALAVASLVGTMALRTCSSRLGVLLLCWVVPYFLIIGAFDVKFMRYLLPITPFLLLFGSELAIAIWKTIRKLPCRTRRTAVFVGAAIGLIGAAATGFYALSYMSIYTEPHPAVQASEWIRKNVPAGSTVLKEHWEESLPDLGGYEQRELQMYNFDSEGKFRAIAEELAAADFLVFYSNRLYGTIPRLPERYPLCTEYYNLLFSHQLGYSLEVEFVTYPRLAGLAFVDDTYVRPGLPDPATPFVLGERPALALNLGSADESFTVYDHPKVLVFRNVHRLDSSTIFDRIVSGAERMQPSARGVVELPPSDPRLMLSPDQVEARRAGGTWTDIVDPEGWTSRIPLAAWLIVVQGVSLISFPIAFLIFRPLADRGWLFSKVLGLLLVGLVTWLAASLELMRFTQNAVAVATVTVFLLSLVVWIVNGEAIWAFLRNKWKTIAVGELVFMAAFLAFLAIRMANPDLWHPFRGGEKPMDMAYLNAVLKSAYMPPYDPWFGGGALNYYYWGQFLVATLIHATRIVPEVAINLAIPTFFAMTAAVSYSLVFNLAAATRRFGTGRWFTSPSMAGLLAATFVVVIGNLDGAIQLAQSSWRVVAQGLPWREFDYWRSSRMMPPDPPGHEITEFPFFTFLFADPHAHLFSLPFTVLSLGVAFAIVASASARGSESPAWGLGNLLRVAVLGLVVGALRTLNAWDYPTYLLLGSAAITMREYVAQGGLSLVMLARAGALSAVMLAVGYVAFLPYHTSYVTFFLGVESTTNRTSLLQFLAISGLFVVLIAAFYVVQLRGALTLSFGWVCQLFCSLRDAPEDRAGAQGRRIRPDLGPSLVLAGLSGLLILGYLLTAVVSGPYWGTILGGVIMLGLTLSIALRMLRSSTADSPVGLFALLMAGTGFAIVVGLDLVRIEGDIERMNSVFKFYLQVWVLFALTSAYFGWKLWVEASGHVSSWGRRGWLWVGVLAVLLIGSSVYTVAGTRDRLSDRFYGNTGPIGLNGLAYAQSTVYRDPKGDVDLAADLEGIRWLRDNVRGSPVVLEANTPTYRWGGRVSIHTGLPTVVGWEWHQQQQRWDSRFEVSDRIEDVERIYSTLDPDLAIDLIRNYDVRYIYLGQLERIYYPAEGLKKFDGDLATHLAPVFRTERVTIYQVNY